MERVLIKMREVTFDEYLDFVSKHKSVLIENEEIELEPIEVKYIEPPVNELTDVSTTVWSFPLRGSWATHKGNYRGNWAPQIPRALIEMYTKPGDLILDPMVGGGTTLIEARLLGRNAIGVDINYNAVILTLHRLYYLEKALEHLKKSGLDVFFDSESVTQKYPECWYRVYHGDVRNLNEIKDESIDLIATHPPYFNIIRYSRGKVEGDLSKTNKLEKYLKGMKKAAEEMFRVLKPGKYCALLIGDTRVHKHFVPISHYVLQVFLDAGFILKEEVIKIQHKMKTTREIWNRLKTLDFLLIYHEKLFIFRKPDQEEDLDKFKYSRKLTFSI